MSVVWAPYSQLPPFCLQRLVIHRDLNAFNFGFGPHEYNRQGITHPPGQSYGIPGGFGGVLAAGRGGPPERAVGELVDCPA